MKKRIPITIIAGFLGSGKTTLLQRFTQVKSAVRVLYLINDFSANDVDGVIVSRQELNVKSIAGGSIFCNCKITDFIEALKITRENENSFDEIIIEASGIANPLAAEVMLQESKLDQIYYINQVINIIDATNFSQLIKSLISLQNQVKSADIIIINKIDLADQNQLTTIANQIRTINQTAKILSAEYCEIALTELAVKRQQQFTAPTAKVKEYSTFSIRSRKNLQLDDLKKYLSENTSIHRVKGFAKIDGKLHQINYSGSGWEIQQTTKSVNPHLEFIYYAPENERVIDKIGILRRCYK